MQRIRVSPGFIVLAVLVLAVTAGGATAAHLITGRQIKNHSIGIADLTYKAQKLLHGRTGRQGPAGPAGPPGPAGPASTVAYAHVSKSGGVIAASSKNVVQANVVRTGAGQYCIRGLSTAIKSAVASPSGGSAIGAVIGSMTVVCNFVVTTRNAAGNRVDSAFYIQLA
jgi:hypothetical protein